MRQMGPEPNDQTDRQESGFPLRPHHALCAQFFAGKGYSEAFVAHMHRVLTALDHPGACVSLVDACDGICAGCPNNRNGVCETDAKVRAIDRRALAAMGLSFGDTLLWRDLCERAKIRILAPGKLCSVCGDCEWIDICQGRLNSEEP